MKQIIFFLISVTFLFAETNITLQLKWKNAFQFAGFYMAKEKGFYKNEGLNVKINEYNGSNPVDLVLKNKAEFGISNFDFLIKEKLLGKKVVAIMPIFKQTPLAYMSVNPNIKSVKDFKHKVICTPNYHFYSLDTYILLKEAGLSYKDVIHKNIMFSLNSVKKKECDIYGVYKTDEPYTMKMNHLYYKIFSVKYPLYGDILFTSEKYRFSHPDIVEKFKKASIKGWKYAINHIDETIKVIMKKYNTQHFSYKKLHFEAIETKKLISNFKFNNQKIENIKLITKVFYNINNDFSLVEFIYSPYIKTKKEVEYIKNHTITTINTYTWPPFIMLKNDEFSGISKDIFDIIKNKLFLNTDDYMAKNFTNVLNAIKSNKADITFATMENEAKKNIGIFTKPYLTYKIAIATIKDKTFIPNMKLLFGKKVAIGKNYTAYNLIKTHYPQIKIITTKNTKEALKLLSQKKVYAVIDIFPVLAYYISSMNLYNIKINGNTPFDFKISFMLNKNDELLKRMINRVIKDINPNIKYKILKKYVPISIQKGYSKNYIELSFKKFYLIIAFLVTILVISIILLIKISYLQKKLKQLAYYDKLTDIYNRHKMNEFLNYFINLSKRYKEPLSLIYFDIDFFKKVNDTYGHEKGDKVLKEISRFIKNYLRESDIIARWGGEEFIILLPNTNIHNAKKIAEKLRKEIENLDIDGIKVTISLGVTELKEDDNLDTLTNRADKALYKAKEHGRNRVETI